MGKYYYNEIFNKIKDTDLNSNIDFSVGFFKKEILDISIDLIESINDIINTDLEIKDDDYRKSINKYCVIELIRSNNININLALMSYKRIQCCITDLTNDVKKRCSHHNINIKFQSNNLYYTFKVKFKPETKNQQDFINNVQDIINSDIINIKIRKKYIYFETADLHILNTQLNDIFSLIVMILNEEISSLVHKIQDKSEIFTIISYNISYIDMLLSFSKLSINYKFSKPIFCSKFETIYMENFINPIILLSDNVSNKFNTELFYSFDNSKINIIYGDNLVGKTTFLKTLLYVVILSQIGCFVPCGVYIGIIIIINYN